MRDLTSLQHELKEAKKEFLSYQLISDVKKLGINGSFGKLGSKYSALYSPQLLIQTTLTGQLALLVLIEGLEAAGAEVMSANTDGVVVLLQNALEADVEAAAWGWSLDTSFELERTDYKLIASRDVNNYLAVKTNGKTKGKGVFAPIGLAKNPDGQIVYRAVAEYLVRGVPLDETIRGSKDVREFVSVRKVTGGATWRDEYLGRAVRFYASTEISRDEVISYAKNSNKVPNSDGCRPLMTLPDTFPDDVDLERYIADAEQLLEDCGA